MPTLRIVDNYSRKFPLRVSNDVLSLVMVNDNDMKNYGQHKSKKVKLCEHITGNQPRWALVAMVRALSMFSRFNTKEEDERLAAAKYLLAIR